MKKFDLIKFKMATFSAIIHFHMHGRYLVNRARWLDHYFVFNMKSAYQNDVLDVTKDLRKLQERICQEREVKCQFLLQV